MQKLHTHFNPSETPQKEPIPGRADMIPNNEGGYVFGVDKWQQLRRFLVLGSAGGTYYQTEKQLTVENASVVADCLAEDGLRTVAEIVSISDGGRAPNNDPALFALAMASSERFASVHIRQYALESLPLVARIPTHLFTFNTYVEAMRGRGRSLNKAIRRWYNDKSPESLALHMVKYRQRGGVSHRDMLRLAKPKPADDAHNYLYGYAVGKKTAAELFDNEWRHLGPLPDGDWKELISNFDALQSDKISKSMLIGIINAEPRITWEVVPTKWLGDPDVWAALLPNMPYTATLRNLARMTANGLLSPLSEAVNVVSARLTDPGAVAGSRVHPMAVLTAMLRYGAGEGDKGSLRWSPVPKVLEALDAAFYQSFGNVRPTGKSTLLALDVSGSMSWENIGGVKGLTPRVACAAMAMVTARVESNYATVAFSHKMERIHVGPRQRLDDVCAAIDKIPMGGTDCALPMIWAEQSKIKNIDAFVVYTDNQTHSGGIHPTQALDKYRKYSGVRDSALAVIGMTSTGFTIADPKDARQMDFVGFDTATPNILSDFIRGEL